MANTYITNIDLRDEPRDILEIMVLISLLSPMFTYKELREVAYAFRESKYNLPMRELWVCVKAYCDSPEFQEVYL